MTFQNDIREQVFAKASVILTILAIIILNLSYFPGNILSWDVFGYYLILPQVFIYHDVLISDPGQLLGIIEQYNSTATFYQAMPAADGAMVMKYSLGMAVIYLPFFLAGHGFALISNFPADGYSLPYQAAILGGGMLYTIMGFLFLRSLLMRYLPDKVTAFTLILIYFGSNLLFHSSMYGTNAMSHNFLFGLYGAILWLSDTWQRNGKRGILILLAMACGMAILARPTELICLFIPLLLGLSSRKAIIVRIKRIFQNGDLILFAFVLALFGSIQLVYWKFTTGHFFFTSYGGNPAEGLDLLRPHIGPSLLSFRKGWFIYTPLALLAFTGMVPLFKERRELFLGLLVFLVLNIYLVSSWTNWWYAQSFGQRSYIPALAVLSLPLGFLLKWLSVNLKRLLPGIVVLTLVIILNLFQTWQYTRGIIHPDRMTAAYYLSVFGESRIPESADSLLLVDRSFDGEELFQHKERYHVTLDTTLDFGGGVTLDTAHRFSDLIRIPFRDLTKSDHAWIEGQAIIVNADTMDARNIHIIMHFNYKGRAYGYRGSDTDNTAISSKGEGMIRMEYLTPEVRRKQDRFISYVYYTGVGSVLVKSLNIKVYNRK